MGAVEFRASIVGYSDPKSAFSAARRQALWDHGHSGYTGTIAEKSDFMMFALPDGYTPSDYFAELYRLGWSDQGPLAWGAAAATYNNKWGPAVCVEYEGAYHFGGMASD